MIQVHPEYIIDKHSHKTAVIIPFNEWEQILEQMEELEDIKAYDTAKKNTSDSILFEQAVQEIESGIIK